MWNILRIWFEESCFRLWHLNSLKDNFFYYQLRESFHLKHCEIFKWSWVTANGHSTTAAGKGFDSSHSLHSSHSPHLALHSDQTEFICLHSLLFLLLPSFLLSLYLQMLLLPFGICTFVLRFWPSSYTSFVFAFVVLVHVTCMRLFAWPSTCTKVSQMTLRVGVAPAQCIVGKTAKNSTPNRCEKENFW